MIKFPGSPPRAGPLCLPDGWPTRFFLRPLCQARPVGVEWRAFWGGTKDAVPASALPPSPRALSPPLAEPDHAWLQWLEGAHWSLPLSSLSLGWPARNRGQLGTSRPQTGQSLGSRLWAHGPARDGAGSDLLGTFPTPHLAQRGQGLGQGHTDPLARDRRSRGRLTSIYKVRISQGKAWALFLGMVPPSKLKVTFSRPPISGARTHGVKPQDHHCLVEMGQ